MLAGLDTLDTLVALPIRYNLHGNPDTVTSVADALHVGANCKSGLHLALRETVQLTLPPRLQAWEIYKDITRYNRYFHNIGLAGRLALGDVVVFGFGDKVLQFQPVFNGGDLVNESPVRHVAMATGRYYEDQPELFHFSQQENGPALWLLPKFGDYELYRNVLAVGRPKVDMSV